MTIHATLRYVLSFSFFFSILACRDEKIPATSVPENVPDIHARFTLLAPEQTGVQFSNNFLEDFNYNIYTYEYLYNGCGVAVGDVNGDGLPDLYFAAAFGSNKLYINLGDFKFADVTEAAGVAAQIGYKTGVNMADVNGDGLMDIHCARTSKDDDGQKNDHMFINLGVKDINGMKVPIFEDQAKVLGLEDNSNTNHACFFDFDGDGDLDLFILNHRTGFDEATKIRVQQNQDGTTSRITTPDTPFESNRLYRNDKGRFVDITAATGLTNSAFGLSVTAADINQDGWMDLYIANDYIEPDYIYINNKDGTFTDKYPDFLRHSSQNSMGADIADINNDGLVDIMVLDMKSEDPIRYKELANVMQLDRYNLLVQYGYGRQAGRNVLQLNAGNNAFIEIGQFAGVSATDWSWAPLVADFDNDGWRDMYITNGYRKDVTNLDYMNFFKDSIYQTGGLNPKRFPDINEFLKYIPSQKISNYLYINNTNLGFINAAQQAGMDHPSFSNGAAYADLDADGDLDIIVNNIEDPAFIYRNDSKPKNWLQIETRLSKGNTKAIGTAIDVYSATGHQYAMISSNKGFLSTSEPIAHFGLGSTSIIDSIILRWPDGHYEIMRNVTPNQRILWEKQTGDDYVPKPAKKEEYIFDPIPKAFKWTHRENDFNDFKREKLIPYMISAEGPCIAVGDFNGDQLDDIFAGNGSGYQPALFAQKADGTFSIVNIPAFVNDSVYEDCGSVFEDFDGDGDVDLMVISGGSSFNPNDLEYLTRLYINDGKGGLTRSAQFPIVRTNAGAILVVDLDGDNDKDVIIGGRSTPGSYPTAPKSYYLRNDQGKFSDATASFFPALDGLGMITDMASADLDNDGKPELIIVGDWMPVTIFSMVENKMINRTDEFGFDKTAGWWKCVHLADIDGDGDVDMLVGNIGLNHRLIASENFPATLISNDFDENGSIDPIMCYYYQGNLYPYVGRDGIIAQIPALKKKFLRYTPYAKATIEDIFTREELKKSTYHYAHTFQTTLFKNDGTTFTASPLPYQVQLSPTFDMVIEDFNQDGLKDILMAGNFLYSEPETGELDAGTGVLLLQQRDGTFEYQSNLKHGFWAPREARELELITLTNGTKAILTANNRGNLELHAIKTMTSPVQ